LGAIAGCGLWILRRRDGEDGGGSVTIVLDFAGCAAHIRAMDNDQIRQRFTVLTWAVGATLGMLAALLGSMISISFQLGHVTGELSVLIGHVQLK
jgi:hypothetical protein